MAILLDRTHYVDETAVIGTGKHLDSRHLPNDVAAGDFSYVFTGGSNAYVSAGGDSTPANALTSGGDVVTFGGATVTYGA